MASIGNVIGFQFQNGIPLELAVLGSACAGNPQCLGDISMSGAINGSRYGALNDIFGEYLNAPDFDFSQLNCANNKSTLIVDDGSSDVAEVWLVCPGDVPNCSVGGPTNRSHGGSHTFPMSNLSDPMGVVTGGIWRVSRANSGDNLCGLQAPGPYSYLTVGQSAVTIKLSSPKYLPGRYLVELQPSFLTASNGNKLFLISEGYGVLGVGNCPTASKSIWLVPYVKPLISSIKGYVLGGSPKKFKVEVYVKNGYKGLSVDVEALSTSGSPLSNVFTSSYCAGPSAKVTLQLSSSAPASLRFRARLVYNDAPAWKLQSNIYNV